MYRGRLAPSPTGFLHLGHARAFAIAAARAKRANGTLILRIEDIDRARSRPEFETAILDDLRWLGISWQEGPYRQSERLALYHSAFLTLRESGALYPCLCSRNDIRQALAAPHAADDGEPAYPGTCRHLDWREFPADAPVTWRFRVPDGETIAFQDALVGLTQFRAGTDFGDFPVWRKDGLPSYQLAVTADDHAMEITEVVRGTDLLISTARQLLLYRALGWTPPAFAHCPLVSAPDGTKLSKRDGALGLAALRANGTDPTSISSVPEELLRGVPQRLHP